MKTLCQTIQKLKVESRKCRSLRGGYRTPEAAGSCFAVNGGREFVEFVELVDESRLPRSERGDDGIKGGCLTWRRSTVKLWNVERRRNVRAWEGRA